MSILKEQAISGKGIACSNNQCGENKDTITNKVNVIEQNMYEIVERINEISRVIYGGDKPKITQEVRNDSVNSIEFTLNSIGACSDDVRNMLQDILRAL